MKKEDIQLEKNRNQKTFWPGLLFKHHVTNSPAGFFYPEEEKELADQNKWRIVTNLQSSLFREKLQLKEKYELGDKSVDYVPGDELSFTTVIDGDNLLSIDRLAIQPNNNNK